MEAPAAQGGEDEEDGETQGATAVLYLIVGNTRLHWGWVESTTNGDGEGQGHSGRYLHWNTDHSTPADDDAGAAEKVHGIPASFLPASFLPASLLPSLHTPHPHPRRLFHLLLAGSVVPAQHVLWRARCPYAHTITTDTVFPPGGSYPGLGVDRALALRGAGEGDGWPCLVVDAGTALTFTVGDASGGCAGGAILPGLRLAVQALATRTALLPAVALPSPGGPLPGRFARATGEAIRAGVLHGALATIREYVSAFLEEGWGQQEAAAGGDGEESRPVVFTGGDAPLLFAAIQQQEQHQQTATQGQGRKPQAQYVLRDDLAFRGLHSLARTNGWLPPGVPPVLPPVAVLLAVGPLAAVGGEGHLDSEPCVHQR